MQTIAIAPPQARPAILAWPLLIALVLVTRLPALLHWGPIDDEAVYAVVGKVMLHGGLPAHGRGAHLRDHPVAAKNPPHQYDRSRLKG